MNSLSPIVFPLLAVNSTMMDAESKTIALSNIDFSGDNRVVNKMTLNASDKVIAMENRDDTTTDKEALNSVTLNADTRTITLANSDATDDALSNNMVMDAAGKTITMANFVGTDQENATIKNEIKLDSTDTTTFNITNKNGAIVNTLSFNAKTGAFSIGSAGASREGGIRFDPETKMMSFADAAGNSIELHQNANSKESIKIKDGTGNIIITDEYGIRLEAAAGKKLLLGEANYSKGGFTNCNNLPVCLFSGAPHGTSAVQVPMAPEPVTEVTPYSPNNLGNA